MGLDIYRRIWHERREYVWKTLLSLVSERIKYLFALYQCSIEGIEDTLQIIHLNHVIEFRKSSYMLSLKDQESILLWILAILEILEYIFGRK